MNRKILLSLGVVVFVVAASMTATGAFFSDTETSSGNTFTAGSIDLSLGSQFTSMANGTGTMPILADNDGRALYNFTDIKPGDSGSGSFDLVVTSNESYACAMSTLDGTPDNGIVDPEGDAGDVTTGGPNDGELQNFLQIAIFHDQDGDGVYDVGEPLNANQLGDNNGFTFAEIAAAGWISVADTTAPNTWLAPFASLTPSTEYHAGFLYCFGNINPVTGACAMYPLSSNDNLAQTDSISGSIEFMAVQTRNNAGFMCSSLNATSTPPVETISWTTDGTRTGGSATVGATTTESGTNALTLITTPDTDSRVRYNYDIADINLSAFTGFSYDSKQVSATDMVNGNASFRLVVDLDGNLLTLGDVTDVTYEPYYNILAHNPLNDASITTGAWQNWAATVADGKFWAGGVTTELGASEGAGGAYATNFTIAQLLAAYPSAKITGISIGMGTYNVNQVVVVDNLIFNGNVLGFE